MCSRVGEKGPLVLSAPVQGKKSLQGCCWDFWPYFVIENERMLTIIIRINIKNIHYRYDYFQISFLKQ